MAKKLGFEDSGGVLQRQIDVDDSDKKLKLYDNTDALIGSLEILLNPSFGTEQTITVGATSTATIPKGFYMVSLGANTSVEYSPDGGTTWRTLIPAGQGGLVVSDGANVRLNNAGTAAEDSYLLPIE